MTSRFSAASIVHLFARHEPASGAAPSLEWINAHARLVAVDGVQERRDSVIIPITLDDADGVRNAIVKQHRQLGSGHLDGSARARSEFDILNSLRARLLALPRDLTGGITYSVPKPLILDEARGALIMECAAGSQLETIVRDARNHTPGASALLAPLRRAGTWLRLMQQITRRKGDGRTLLQPILDDALHTLDHACAIDRVVRRHTRQIAATLRTLARTAEEMSLPLVGRHGDFSSGNIFMTDDHVDVIDFEAFRDGLPLEDAAFFLVHLELYFVYPLVSRALPKLIDAFLDGFRGGEPLDEGSLRFFTIASALQFLAHGGLQRQGFFRGMWRRRALHRTILRRLI
jgi:hypothetical protein